jgi:L,D-peptidoglycan transpeptidase YkuD (ErfK/YbiS/YcfS/YnhG family)
MAQPYLNLYNTHMIISVWPNSQINDRPASDGQLQGQLQWSDHVVPCALGRGGINAQKQEGDGRTPIGRFPLRSVFYRPDRIDKPITSLSVHPLQPDMGWCDDPTHQAYNTLVRQPFSAGHEQLWRTDTLYDVIVAVGHNDNPVIPRHGSAIFLHVAHPQYQPTEGCVAIAVENLLGLLKQCDQHTLLDIQAQTPKVC